MTANTKLVTNNFKSYHVNQFIESITEPANTIFYMFAGKHTPYEGGDANIVSPNNSIQSTYVDVYDNMLFGKHITQNDVSVMIPRHDWVSNTIFTQYDHTDGNLQSKSFYTVTTSGTNRYVFKCLYNVDGAPSTAEPDFNETGADDILYQTADGYQWKYLYTIDQATWNKFATPDYIPVVPDANVTANAVSGSIDVIAVTSGGAGYNNYYAGQFGSADTLVGGNNIIFNLGSAASSANDYYTGAVITITEGTGKGQYRKINSYTVIANTKQIVVNNAFSTTPDATSQYEISPYVEIIGNGTQTINCEARALINSSASNSVYRVEVLNRGAGYLYASANVNVSNVISITNSASLSVIIPPAGGHGANVQSELGGTRLGISVNFANNESDTIISENDYRTIGIIKDPKFNEITLSLSNVSGTFSGTEYVYQVRKIKLQGEVSINATSNVITSNSVNFEDALKAEDYIFIVDESGQEISNIVVTSGGSGYETGEALTFTDGGGSNAAGIAVAVNGTIVSVKFDSINSLSVSTAGSGFTNDEIVTITGVSSGSSNASGIVVTDGSGGLTDVIIVDSGSSYISGETVDIYNSNTTGAPAGAIATISVTSACTTYTNGTLLTIIGQTSLASNATGSAVTDGSGNLIDVIIINPGSSYINEEGVQINDPDLNAAFGDITTTAGSTNATATIITTAGGSGFTNSETLTITGSNSTVNVATAIATTNSTGGLVSASLIDGAYNYVQNETLQISSSGSTINATAKAETANGVVRSVIITNMGYGYTSAPTVDINTVSGSGVGLTAVVNTASIAANKMLARVGTVANSSQITITSNGTFTGTGASIYLANVGAYGLVDSFNVSTLILNNSRGFFTANAFIVGNTSLATANIDSIQISNTSKAYTTFLQTIRYEGSSITGTFEEDEQITQSLEGLEVANAYLTIANSINNTLYATQQHGNFLIANTIIGNSSGAEMTINNIYKGDIVPWSGDIIYLQNIEPISRVNNQTETIKIILEL